MDAATRLRADPEVRQLIGESERLLRLLFLINAPGSDWSVNEAYQERAFQQAQEATQGMAPASADAGGEGMATEEASGGGGDAAGGGKVRALRRRGSSLEERAEEKRVEEERLLCQIEAEAVAAAKTDQQRRLNNSSPGAHSSPGSYGMWKAPRGKVALALAPTPTPSPSPDPNP